MFLDGHYFAVVEGIYKCKVELDKEKLYIERMIDRTQLGTKRSEFYVLRIEFLMRFHLKILSGRSMSNVN